MLGRFTAFWKAYRSPVESLGIRAYGSPTRCNSAPTEYRLDAPFPMKKGGRRPRHLDLQYSTGEGYS